MIRLSNSIFILMLLGVSSLTFAWDANGHQQVGAIATQLIAGTNAEQHVKALLGDMSLATASVWADCAKGVRSSDDQTFTYMDDPKYTECKPFSNPENTAAFVDFVKRNWRQCGTAHDYEYCHNQYHYTDVSTFDHRYDDHDAGTNDHDVVHAITAAIKTLQGLPTDAPFSFASQREALILLAHYVGDIHQPLHVQAIYLDAHGHVVNPDVTGVTSDIDTAGGNRISIPARHTTLHHAWDETPSDLMIGSANDAALLNEARHTPKTTGHIDQWSNQWATDTIHVSKFAFAGLTFSQRPDSASDTAHHTHQWDATGIDDVYEQREHAVKAQQLAKAGAHLAQILKTIWPDQKAATAKAP